MKKDLFKGLDEEQIEKARACETASDLLQLAKDEGVELSEEQLDDVNGGGCVSGSKPNKCSNCGSTRLVIDTTKKELTLTDWYYDCKCKDCGHQWTSK